MASEMFRVIRAVEAQPQEVMHHPPISVARMDEMARRIDRMPSPIAEAALANHWAAIRQIEKELGLPPAVMP